MPSFIEDYVNGKRANESRAKSNAIAINRFYNQKRSNEIKKSKKPS